MLLDTHAVAAQFVSQYASIDNRAARHDMAQLATHNIRSASTRLVAHALGDGRLTLVYASDLVSQSQELGGEHIEGGLWHTDHFHFYAICELQVAFSMADDGIFFVQFVKLALLKKKHGIPMVLLHFPKLSFKRRERFPCTRGNVQRAFIVMEIAGAVHVLISQIQEKVVRLFILDALAFFFLDALFGLGEVRERDGRRRGCRWRVCWLGCLGPRWGW